jgi:hypothetical protein
MMTVGLIRIFLTAAAISTLQIAAGIVDVVGAVLLYGHIRPEGQAGECWQCSSPTAIQPQSLTRCHSPERHQPDQRPQQQRCHQGRWSAACDRLQSQQQLRGRQCMKAALIHYIISIYRIALNAVTREAGHRLITSMCLLPCARIHGHFQLLSLNTFCACLLPVALEFARQPTQLNCCATGRQVHSPASVDATPKSAKKTIAFIICCLYETLKTIETAIATPVKTSSRLPVGIFDTLS